ncbi:MAG TPA: hypothetical protein VFW15_10865 [Thermoanaerobaculia bacterium]|nr:hypothetical protein [Thermoanaerobaculia bacterium]
MSSERRWGWPLALVSLTTVTVLGTSGCCTVKCCESTARIIVVSDTDTVPVDPIVISKKAKQEIVWRLPAKSTISNVAITLGKNTAPFEGCETTEGLCRIACHNGACASGAVNASLVVPNQGLYYGYAFARPASAASKDPGIRIDP